MTRSIITHPSAGLDKKKIAPYWQGDTAERLVRRRMKQRAKEQRAKRRQRSRR